MEDVGEVGEGELESVLALGQIEGDLGLALAVVEAFSFDGGNGHLGFEFRDVHVDQKVMMPGVREVGAGGADAHTLESKADGDGPLDGFAVLEAYDVGPGTLGRWSLQRVGRLGSILSGGDEERGDEGNGSE